MQDNIDYFVRSANYILVQGGLTPLQIDEIEKAIQSHRSYGADPNVNESTLQHQRDRINSHWNEISSTFGRRGYAIERLDLFVHSLAGIIVEEYYDIEPPLSLVPMRNYLNIYGNAEDRQKAANILTEGDIPRLDTLFEKTIIFAISELLLDREHVEDRLRIAASGGKLSRSLIDANDYVRLEKVLEKDGILLHQLALFKSMLKPIEMDFPNIKQRLLNQSSLSKSMDAASASSSLWTFLGLRNEAPKSVGSSLAQLLLSKNELMEKKTV